MGQNMGEHAVRTIAGLALASPRLPSTHPPAVQFQGFVHRSTVARRWTSKAIMGLQYCLAHPSQASKRPAIARSYESHPVGLPTPATKPGCLPPPGYHCNPSIGAVERATIAPLHLEEYLVKIVSSTTTKRGTSEVVRVGPGLVARCGRMNEPP